MNWNSARIALCLLLVIAAVPLQQVLAEDQEAATESVQSAPANNDGQADKTKPNIVFLMTDDQRWDTLGCYGRTDVITPNIDRLAAQGVTFDNAFYAVAICMPSRTTMFTGRYFSDHRVGFTYPFNRTLPKEEFAKSYPAQLKRRAIARASLVSLAFVWKTSKKQPRSILISSRSAACGGPKMTLNYITFTVPIARKMNGL